MAIRVSVIPDAPFDQVAQIVWATWQTTKQTRSFEEAYYAAEDTERAEAVKLAREILLDDLPVAHFATFTICVEGHARTWLDQVARELTTGIVMWTGSHRIMNASRLHADHLFQNAVSVDQDPRKAEVRDRHMQLLEQFYREEIEAGLTPEEARDILPQNSSIPVIFRATLRQLRWIVSKRSSFVFQSSLWGPVIDGIIDELSEWDAAIGEKFRQPPCKLRGVCPYRSEMETRSQKLPDGRWLDPNPICPLYVDVYASPEERSLLLAIALEKHADWRSRAEAFFHRVGHVEQSGVVGLTLPLV